jgi:hypothetical protein
MVERRVFGRQRHPQLQLFAFDLPFANDALDLPLLGNADYFKEFAQSYVEAFLVIDSGLMLSGRNDRLQRGEFATERQWREVNSIWRLHRFLGSEGKG